MPSRTAARTTDGARRRKAPATAAAPDLTGLPPQLGQDAASEPAPAPQPAPAPAPPADNEVSPEALAAAARFFAPPEVVDPDDDDPVGDQVTFLRGGGIRLDLEGRQLRLRRPSFGQLRELRLALEDLEWELEDLTEDNRVASAKWKADAEAIAADAPDRRARLAAIRAESREAARAYDAATDAAYLGWWRQAIEALSDDGTPADDDMPSWVVNHRLVTQVLNHWRAVPLGRGASKNGQVA